MTKEFFYCQRNLRNGDRISTNSICFLEDLYYYYVVYHLLRSLALLCVLHKKDMIKGNDLSFQCLVYKYIYRMGDPQNCNAFCDFVRDLVPVLIGKGIEYLKDHVIQKYFYDQDELEILHVF